MAASDVDIVNMALARLGDKANVSSIFPSDASVQADHASRFYAQVRDFLLEKFAWKFATTRAALAPRSDISYGSWLYAYAEPNNALRIISILPTGYTADNQGVPFDTEVDSIGQGLILTDAALATARYITRISDPAKFSPGFTECFTWALASVLAGPLLKGEAGRAAAATCLQMASGLFSSATGLSANQSKTLLALLPSNIAARGGTLLTGTDDGTYPVRGF